jgi:uncharacterized protein
MNLQSLRAGWAWRIKAMAMVLMVACGSANAGAYEDFFTALANDDVAGLRQLLSRGMDPNTRDPQGQHGLFLSLRGDAIKSFRLLMEHPQVQVDAPNATDETPLMMASLRGNTEAMRALLAKGAQVDRAGWTPLHYAASGPSSAAVRLLLDLGAPVNGRAPNGNTPLMQAARFGAEDSVSLLLARGADRSLRNTRNYTAADYARLDGRESTARQVDLSPP